MSSTYALGWAFMAVVAAASVAYLIAAVIAHLARLALVAAAGPQTVEKAPPEVRGPVRLVRWTVFILVAPLLCLPALRMAGFDPRAGVAPEVLTAWLLGSGVRIVVVIVAGYVLTRIVSILAAELEAHIGRAVGPDVNERAKRAKTLGRLVRSAATIVVVVIATLMVLREIRVDITPILTGAGILGLAVGFGGQTLVRDLISGFFLIVENQIRVGDVAIINGTGGLVEEINLRTVVLRDGEGAVHVFPNGAITQLANRSKDFAFYVADIGVSYRHDPDEVISVLRDVGDELMADVRYRPSILEPLEILGIEGLMDSQVSIRVRIKTLPLKQWEVGRELLRRVKKTFDARGIEIPFPQRAVVVERTKRGLKA